MIAIKRLQSIMWLFFVTLGALAAYLISLSVATERNKLHRTESQILATRTNIRYLEVEFGARSTAAQLTAWNNEAIRYSVPRAGQYLTSERQLVALTQPAPAAPALAAPAPAPAVVVAVAKAEPAPVLALPVRATEATRTRVVPAVAVAEPIRSRPAASLALAKPAATLATVSLVDKAAPSQRRAMRLALLDKTLIGMSAQPAESAAPAKAAR